MIDRAFVARMARYNRWQNESLYGVAAGFTEDERRRERGAFWGSIQKTLSHILWADRTWMSRFSDVPNPNVTIRQSVDLYPDWEPLRRERVAFDDTIIAWADRVDDVWLAEELVWFSAALNREMRKPQWLLVSHFFNHQTHHRGQVHCLLTQAGGKPDDTDLFLMAE
jgi:uncharacterized damage-inducible protein DinB